MQKRISREPLKSQIEPYVQHIGNRNLITFEGEKLIIAAYKGMYTEDCDNTHTNDDISRTSNNNMHTMQDMHLGQHIENEDNNVQIKDNVVFETLQKELEVKNNQIAELIAANRELTAALENTTAGLRAAQALHAGTMHHLTETEAKPEASDKPENIFTRLFRKR